ncbi:hypothetical protein EVB27_033 [Rhizobium phage RHph_TM16]|nr:hypothetical protein EVB27_033 [Rhizobium phage RHph_TM16]
MTTINASLNFARVINEKAYKRVKEALQQHISKDTEDYATQASLLVKLQSLRAAKTILDTANVSVTGVAAHPNEHDVERKIESDLSDSVMLELDDMPSFLRSGPASTAPNTTTGENSH